MNLDPARWPGGPQICGTENLPAFPTLQAMRDFHQANGPDVRIDREWLCSHCHNWHMETKPRPPSGFYSGSSKR